MLVVNGMWRNDREGGREEGERAGDSEVLQVLPEQLSQVHDKLDIILFTYQPKNLEIHSTVKAVTCIEQYTVHKFHEYH